MLVAIGTRNEVLIHTFFCSSGYDCGVYALCFVEVMCKIKLLKEPEVQLQSISEETVQQWRRGTKQLITDLAKENNA